MATQEFTPELLVSAVGRLFQLNHYEVEGPVKLHGAEIDLVARRISDPFASPVYVEATVEYVDNDKYGKDTTKLMLVRETRPDDPVAHRLSKGLFPAGQGEGSSI